MSKLYAVARGRIPGIYPTWDICRRQIHKFPNARFKAFFSHQEAEAFIREHAGPSLLIPDETKREEKELTPSSCGRCKNSLESQVAPALRLRLNTPMKKTKFQIKAEKKRLAPAQTKRLVKTFAPSSIVCWTDGSCLSNPGGPGGAAALLQVPLHLQSVLETKLARDFTPSSSEAGLAALRLATANEFSVCESLPTCTNNVAELTGVSLALQLVNALDRVVPITTCPIHIMTDSQYTQKVLSGEWQSHANLNLVKEIKKRVKERSNKGNTIEYHWVRGHCDIRENQLVDDMAGKAAIKAQKKM